jgi:integrase
MGYIERKPRFQKVSEVERDELVYLYFDEVIKLFESNKWDYENGGHKKNKPNIYVIEEPLLGTRSKEFGNVLKITNWELIKDMFLFLCSIGCRYSDIQHLKVNDFNFEKGLEHFSYIQKKTSKPVRVPINFINGEIFKKYSSGKKLNQLLFPKISIQKFNKGLQLLFEDLGFNRLLSYPKKVGSELINEDEQPLHKLISSHCGRRTFIKNMIDKGLDYRTIMTMSGHRTIREFMKYVSVSPKDLEKGRGLYSTMNNSDETLIKQIQEQIVDLDKNKLVEVSKYINYIKSVN